MVINNTIVELYYLNVQLHYLVFENLIFRSSRHGAVVSESD